MKFLYSLAFFALLLTSCGKDQLEKDEELILDYISDNGLTASRTAEGLYYVIEMEGTGIRPELSDDVTVHYEGFLLDGTKFDSSIDRGTPSTFPLLGVILGWQIGIPLFKEGGQGELLIPSHLAYGENPPPGSEIGKNEVLRFTVELISVP